jgi:hypothetical protein
MREIMEVYRIKLTKEKLAAMPETERVILLLLGHASNEINVLTKLILMTRKDDPTVPLVEHLEVGQTFIILRLLLGKLHEAWLLFTIRLQSNIQMRKKYLANLPPQGEAARAKLNKYFGGGNSSLPDIRNNFSFHYEDENNLIEANFKRIPESEQWEFYLCQTIGNSFYFASELVVAGGVIELARKESRSGVPSELSEDAQSFNALCNTVNFVSREITILFGEIISKIVTDSIGQDVEHSIVEIPCGPKISKFSLPYYFDENDSMNF